MQEQVWRLIHQSQPEIFALVALDQHDRLLGLLHFRTFVRPLAATTGGYVDDLFVVLEARGLGVAQQLIACVVDIGKAKQWSVVRWMTALDNQQARICYDKIAEHTHWQTYEIKLGK